MVSYNHLKIEYFYVASFPINLLVFLMSLYLSYFAEFLVLPQGRKKHTKNSPTDTSVFDMAQLGETIIRHVSRLASENLSQGKKQQHTNELPHDKTNKMTCALSEDTDQPGHPLRLTSLRCPHEERLGP